MYIPPGSSPFENFGGRLSEAVVEKIFGDFPAETVPLLEQMDRVGTGIQYLCPSLALASALDKAGARAWVYRFDRVRPGFEPIGAYHGAELPYMFNQHDDWLPTAETRSPLDQRNGRSLERICSPGGSQFGIRSAMATMAGWQLPDDSLRRYDDLTELHPDLAFCEGLRSHYLP